LLTMLAKSGSGTLAGNAHADTFNMLARSEARKISEICRRDIDSQILDRNFPGQPRLAYFELAANEETDIGDVIDHAEKLGRSGYQIEETDLSERTGYNLTMRTPTDKTVDRALLTDPSVNATYTIANRARVRNRADERALENFLNHCDEVLDSADATAFKPVLDALDKIDAASYPDIESLHKAISDLATKLPEMAKETGATPEQLSAWQKVLGSILVNGMTEEKPAKTKNRKALKK